MKTKRTLLVTGVVSAMMLSAALATAAGETLTLTDLSGAVRIQQGLPCDQTLDMTATIQEGLMHITPQQTTRAGGVLIVSQFTLYGDCSKGRRPSFIAAAPPEVAIPLYEEFVNAVRALGVPVATGRFGAMMNVELVNDGPVTLIVDSR